MATEKTDNDAKIAGGFIKEKAKIAMSRISKDEVIRAVIKTTTTELEVPNEKHMLRLLQASFGEYNAGSTKYENVNAFIVEELEKKTHSRDWVVVIKAFLVLHRLMTMGSVEINAEMHSHRRVFCGAYIKSLADTPDGAQQQRVIEQFSQYMEERLLTEASCGLGARMETEEFGVMLCTISELSHLNKVMVPLLKQLETLLMLEYSDYVVSNEATLLVFDNIIKEAKRLYVLLTDRIKVYLEEFDRVDLAGKKQCLEIYQRYDKAVHNLAAYFESMRSGNRHFNTTIPDLKTLPASLLENMELSILENGRSTGKSSLTQELGGRPPVTAGGGGGVRDLPTVEPLPLKLQPDPVPEPRVTSPHVLDNVQIASYHAPPPPAYNEPEIQPPTKKSRCLSDLFSPTEVSAPHENAAPPSVDLFAQQENVTSSPASSAGVAPPVDLFSGGSNSVSPTTQFSAPLPQTQTTRQPNQQPVSVQRASAPVQQAAPAVAREDSFMTSLFTGGGNGSAQPQPSVQRQPNPASPPSATGAGFDPFAPQPAVQPAQPAQPTGAMDFFAKPDAPTATYSTGPGQHHSNAAGNTAVVPDRDPLTGKSKAW